MKSTLLSILTDADTRQAAKVEAHLSQAISVGVPWFDEA